MEDTYVARTFVSRSRHLADHRPCSRAGSASVTLGTGATRRRVSGVWDPQPWDMPWGCWPVQLIVQARRFFCDAPTCPRRIFVEPFPRVLARYARQTERLRHVLLELAYASNAEMAARLAHWLGYLTSPDTLLRGQRAEPIILPTPQVLGVDAFALRRGVTYATLLVDLERHQPVAVLEGRTAEPLIKWLQAHPAVTILVRDRAEAYALAGRQAVPEALQVADRFHLVRNVGDALKALFHSRRWQQPITATPPEIGLVAPSAPPASAAEAPGKTAQPTLRKRIVWEIVQERRGLGQSLHQIAQVLGVDRRTVRRYVAMAQPPVYPVRRPRPTQLTPYLGYLAERWAQGCHNASRLYRELVQRGYRGSAALVRLVVRPWRVRQEGSPSALTAAQPSRLLLQPGGCLTEGEREALETFLRVNPRLAQGYELKVRFQTLLAECDLPALERWLQAAETSELAPFQSVARSFRQDYEAIQAALVTPWSTGQCEGQICRVKLIKRLGYGRAKLDLLRQRILHGGSHPSTELDGVLRSNSRLLLKEGRREQSARAPRRAHTLQPSMLHQKCG
jgi:transposase